MRCKAFDSILALMDKLDEYDGLIAEISDAGDNDIARIQALRNLEAFQKAHPDLEAIKYCPSSPCPYCQ